MLRQELSDSLKKSLKARDKRSVATIRLILAALKDRDIAARGGDGALSETEILQLLHTMIRQRRESIALYESGGRVDLAEREAEEIAVIERFLPPQIEGEDLVSAVRAVIKDLDAQTIKDMGRTMASLKERYAGRMDFSEASGVVREILV
jgi:uncharacterized protein YqeY